MKTILSVAAALTLAAPSIFAQASPPQNISGNIGGKLIGIKYSAPSVRGRKIFGEGGLVMKDPIAPIWRAGANSATALHTEGDLMIGSLAVPKGDYTIFVNVKDPESWELVINKQTGQWGLRYDAGQDLGHVKMTMSKPPAVIEQLKFSIIDSGMGKGKIQIEWENHIASVPVSVK